ncbi:4'-phosphopantetheinyl transferase superfamily protein [Methylocystis sp. JR02]|uniref:4'-phosphopantetheinyl transferase family protein n=1 Tax=Methylocystis sp. JR02 TaxID=3046284 RepID=UPI0024BB3848|nr:4'-phosphopantetheinyl transferase superfamily protein [Methylocystis sp. JR02]MDJ0449346.1 4'-phosphopantetheinyl transferase superfamily protein [Methylocystis sp. JR02]
MDVTVRALDISGVAPEQWPALTALLDDAERARAARFAFEEDRQSYIAAHALLRAELSRRADRAPSDWRFAATALGKPFLLDPPRDLRFSLTHTRGMVAVAVTEGLEIGVDVESEDRRAESMKLAERFFAPQEVALLRAVEGDARREMFFAVWTLKEAVVKATGQGLSRALDSFAVAPDPPRVTMRDEVWSADHWRLGSFHFALAAQGAITADFSMVDVGLTFSP